MARTTDKARHPRKRAVTLIEAVLYIAVALALIVGGLVFFQQASTVQRSNLMVRQLSAIVAETRVLIKGQPLVTVNSNFFVSDTLDITAYLIAAGAVPPEMVTGPNTLRNPFGGSVAVNAVRFGSFGPAVILMATAVPQAVCTRLLTSSSGSTLLSTGTTPVAGGYLFGGATQSGWGFVNYIMDPTEAGIQCKYGVEAHTIENVAPNTAPFVGPVNVMMAFLVEY